MGSHTNRKVLLLALVFSFMAGFARGDVSTIDGTYKGDMYLYDEGNPRHIPLGVSMVLTDELEKVEVSPGVFEMMKVIDGNFLIDQEGGPFAFSKVRYRLNTSEIDMRYSRTKGVTVGQPASYRLVGKVSADGSISGRVLSGFKGQIGTFKISKTDLAPLTSVTQYVGVWAGKVKLIPEGEYERFGIGISSTGFATINPEQFEFDYSMGKIGHMDFSIAQSSLLNVAVDYLHRRIAMSSNQGGSSLSIEATYDPKTQHLIGYFATQFGGKRGEFDIPKIY